MGQEKELAMAAKKFAECQKTIASLGQQLKSLATVDDILMDSEKPLDELTGEGIQSFKNGMEAWKLGSSNFNLPRTDSEFSNVASKRSYPSKNTSERKPSLSNIRPTHWV